LCAAAGTSGSASPAWPYSKGAAVTDGGVTWREVTGQPAVNGDAANTPGWTANTNYSLTSSIIRNTAGTHYFIVTGDSGSSGGVEPEWSATTGSTTLDNGVTWTCIGAVGDFGAWGAPHARVRTPVASSGYMSPGDTLYVSDRHNELNASNASISSMYYGGIGNPLRVICVDHSNMPPTTLADTATIAVTGGTQLTYSFHAYIYGVVFEFNGSSRDGFGPTSNSTITLEKCTLKQVADSTIELGGAYFYDYMTRVKLVDCAIYFGGSSTYVTVNANYIEIINISLTGSTPTSSNGIFKVDEQARLTVRDSDLSVPATYLINNYYTESAKLTFENCKLNPGTTLLRYDWNPNQTNEGLFLYNCASANVNYGYYVGKSSGTIQHETATVRNGGASDGATSISWKASTGANASFAAPLELDPIAIWNEATGASMTAAVEIASDASLNNDDIWMEIEHLGDSASCKGSAVSTRRGLLALASAVPSSSASWDGSPACRQKLQCAFTPQKKGPVIVRVRLGKPNATVYVDPMITLS
jgi:hypothetical protein